MTGQQILLTDWAFTDPTLPKIRADRILSSGSLFLFDPSHSQGSFDSLGSGVKIPNIAWREASALIAGSDALSLQGAVFINLAANEILVEKTAKKGIHIINSQTKQTADRNWHIQPSVLLRTYMTTNSAHKFYVSLWSTRTRAPLSPVGSTFHFFNDTNNQMFYSPDGSVLGVNQTSKVARDSGVTFPLGRYANSTVEGKLGTTTLMQLGSGMLGAWAGASYQNKQASTIIYRAYIEDLTVSGRSYTDVDTIDYQLYQQAFAAGGKFYGDTFTDPATLP